MLPRRRTPRLSWAGMDGKCWHSIRLEGANRARKWLNEEDVNGYEL